MSKSSEVSDVVHGPRTLCVVGVGYIGSRDSGPRYENSFVYVSGSDPEDPPGDGTTKSKSSV